MFPVDARLYAILDFETLARRSLSLREAAEDLRDAGVRLLQYRDKVNGPREILRAAEEIAEVFAGVEATLILNDRADLAALLGWGVHVGQGDLEPGDAKRVLMGNQFRSMASDAKCLVGVSTHTDEQVIGADASCADYVAVGPVFATSTKLDAEPVVGLEGVRRARMLTRKPLVAIGGITSGNAQSVLRAGADSVAVIGALQTAGRTMREHAEGFLRILG